MAKGKSLKEWLEEQQYYSGKASEATRTLAFAGVAVIWVFYEENPAQNSPHLDSNFILPLLLLTLSLTFDLLHYAAGAIIWNLVYLHHERHTPEKERDDIGAEPWKRKLVTWLFYIKLGALVVAYFYLSTIIFSKLFSYG